MADHDLDHLEAVARAATPGPWKTHRSPITGFDLSVINSNGEAELGTWLVAGVRWVPNAEFIATFDPPTILGLISRLRSTEEQVAYWKSYGEGAMEAQHFEFNESRALRAALAEAVEALDPFAAKSRRVHGAWEDDLSFRIAALVGDIRRAARIVARHKEKADV